MSNRITICGIPRLVSGLCFGLMAVCGLTAMSRPVAAAEKQSESQAAETASDESTAEAESPCQGRVVKDDGSVETGYGYVPNATMGRYVQEIGSSELASRKLQEVCVCWLRSRADSDLDFEVAFFADQNGTPAAEPYAKIASTATEVPKGVAAAGRFYSVDASGVTVPEGKSYVGVHWDPSASTFFFVCVDQNKQTERVNVFSMEDRSPQWTEVGNSKDPIFKPHRAILVRVTAAPPATAP